MIACLAIVVCLSIFTHVSSCSLGIGITLSSCGSAVGTTTQRGFLNYPVLFLLHSVLCSKSCNGANFSLFKLVMVAMNGHMWGVYIFLGAEEKWDIICADACNVYDRSCEGKSRQDGC